MQRLGSRPCVCCVCTSALDLEAQKLLTQTILLIRVWKERPFYSFQSAFFAAHLMTFPGDSSNLPQDCALARSFCSQSLFRRFLCAQREIFPSAFFEDNFRVAPPLMMGLTNKHERKTAEPAHTTSPCANSSIRCANKIHSAIYRAGGWYYI